MAGPPLPPPINRDPARVAESNVGRILGITTTFHALAVLLVGLRMYVRLRISKNAARDDWTMVAAVMCACGGWIVFVIQSMHGLGRHNDTIEPEDLMVYNHAGFWQSVISANLGMGLLKTSIALHLLRLNPGRWYAMILWSSIVFVAAYTFMGAMTFFLHCEPMAAHWNRKLGKCYSIELFVTFALINTSFNIFTDVIFGIVPIPVIWKLQMKRRTRLYLIGILSLGYLAVAMGICKAIQQIAFSKDRDRTFNAWVTFWGFIQLNIGIIAACAPSMKPLVSKALNLGEYGPSSDYASNSHGSAGLRTIGGTGGESSKPRDHYELRSMEGDSDSEKRISDENARNGNMLGHTSASAAFYTPADEDRMGSQEMILRGLQKHGEVKGIVMTKEITIS